MIRILKNFNNLIAQGGHWNTGTTFHRNHAASSSIVVFNNKIFFYFRGVADNHTSTIGVYSFTPSNSKTFKGYNWDNKYLSVNPIIAPSTKFADLLKTTIPIKITLISNMTDTSKVYWYTGALTGYNNLHLYQYKNNKWTDLGFYDIDTYSCGNPCATVFNNRIFLYYRAERLYLDENGKQATNFRIGIATSTDGITFQKAPTINNIIYDRVYNAPFSTASCLAIDNYMYLAGAKNIGTSDKPQYTPMLYRSSDGKTFSKVSDITSLGSGWDSYSLSTGKLFYNSPYLYYIYCGSDSYDDYNEGVGLVRSSSSSNFKTWEKYSWNPIMIRGSSGLYDEGGVWGPFFYPSNDKIYVFYEGFGTGNLVPGSTNSKTCRDNRYGGIYVNDSSTPDGFSYSSMCWGYMNINANSFNTEWDVPHISGTVYIKNLANNKYLNISSTVGSKATFSTAKAAITIYVTQENSFARLYANSNYLGINSSVDGRNINLSMESVASVSKKAHFLLHHIKGDYYYIQNRHSGLYLEANGNYVSQNLISKTPAFIWKITK